MSNNSLDASLSAIIGRYADYINDWAHGKGFYEEERDVGTHIALIHSELSEALEAAREGNPESTKLEGFSELEEEMADTMIRIMDTASELDLNLGDAIVEKMKVNEGRKHKHGKEF